MSVPFLFKEDLIMLKAIKDFPLYDDKILVNYEPGDFVPVRDKELIKKLILSGKCELHDPREKVKTEEAKIVDVYEKKIDTPIKKRKRKS